MPPDPPDPSDGHVLVRLWKTLDSNGYDAANVERLTPKEATGAYQDGWYNPILRRTEPTTPLATLTRLFALGLDVPASDLDDVAGADVSDWKVTGLVAVHRRTVHPLVSVQPFRTGGAELRLVSDVANPSLGKPPFSDFVMGAVGLTSQLAKMTLRRPVARALDVGTGNGVQAILASRHCQSVVATDVNPRALAFARFNMAWNGVENVELRLGDRFEPVVDEEFDLIVSNPPFVVSPATTVKFRDSGLPTDAISETTVAGAAEHLAAGGWAQIMCQWVHREGERWQDRVQKWLAGTGCDAWVVQRALMDPVAHASQWLTELGRADPKEADRQFEQWMDYFDREGIVGVGTGFVVLRRTAGQPNWFLPDDLPLALADDCGETVASVFDTQDWLVAHPEPGAVLNACWLLVDHVKLHTTSSASAAARWAASERSLEQAEGLRISANNVPDDVAEIVARCDGRRTLRSIAMEVFQGRWRDPERRTAEVEPAMRKLVGAGFLVPMTESP
jgi:methylase of polypeptide subunit release factors